MTVLNGKQLVVYNDGGIGIWCRDLTPGFIYPLGISPTTHQYFIIDNVGDVVELFRNRIFSFTFISLKEGDKLLRYSGSEESEEWNTGLTVGKPYILDDGYIIDDVFDPVAVNHIRMSDFTEVEL